MQSKIQALKREKNAVILAHYYTPDEVQQVADFVGDSFYLAKCAKNCAADRIVFCGVSFMGESAKILNPEKIVLMPNPAADCPMAHMVKDGVIEKMRRTYDDLAVVCYINSTAELKSQSDVCVTSSNAVQIVKNLPNHNIFFIPDRNLGRYVAEQVPEKNIILNDGGCPVHQEISAAEVAAERKAHPKAKVLSHPECNDDILSLSDYVGSTAELIDYAKRDSADQFIVCTEVGILYRLMEENPEKRFWFPRKTPCCPDMKTNTQQTVLAALEQDANPVEISEELRQKALIPLERMLEMTKR